VASKQNVLSVAGVLSGALVWGLVWYPYRVLQDAGVSGALATALSYGIALLMGVLIVGPVWRELRSARWLGIALMLCAGWTNFAYVMAVLEGEVMRVLLLFYLAPLWTVLFAHRLLQEKLNRYGYLVITLSVVGAVVMLWQPGLGLPVPQSRAEWLGLSAGMSFALVNVLVRRSQHISLNFKSASIWFGTALLTGTLVLYQGSVLPQIAAITPASWVLLALIGVAVCATSFAVQHGVTHLPANQAVVLFLSELVFAAIASYFLADEKMELREIFGAALIVSASLLSGKIHIESQTESETASERKQVNV
jgi:drug/metabolite transporter (DMT)-like permease